MPAAKAAGIHEMIVRLADGYETSSGPKEWPSRLASASGWPGPSTGTPSWW